jgi:hypothetical protein
LTDDLDIYRAAKLVIERHGGEAMLLAEARAVVLTGEGDVEGGAIWQRIKAAVEELQRQRRPDETTNRSNAPQRQLTLTV